MPKIFTLRNVVVIAAIAIIWRMAATGVFKKLDKGDSSNGAS